MIRQIFHFKTSVLLLIISGVILFSCHPKTKMEVITFKTEQGWGYQLEKDKKIFIRQAFIPGISGNQSFVSKNEAERTGKLLLKKILMKQHPSISISELDSMNITRSNK